MTQIKADGLWWDTDVVVLTQMWLFWHRCSQIGYGCFVIFFYLCLIRVNPYASVVCFQMCRLRLIIDCMWKNGGKEQNGLRKYSVCAAAQAAIVYNYKHKPRIAGGPAFSISRFRDWKPFFSETILCCGALLFGFDSDKRGYTQIGHGCFYFIIICVPSVLIPVHLWLVFRWEGSARELTACKKMAHTAEELDKNRREASQGHEIHFVRATAGSPIPNTHNRGFRCPACR